MTSPAHIAALALALLVVQPATAFAQRRPSEARQQFERGVAALEESRFNDAVVLLRDSYAARPAPIVLYNLGVAYRALGRARDAIDAFSRYLADPERAADPRRLATVREEVAELRQSLVRVTISTTPPDATLSVDGRPQTVEDGALQLDPGAHVIEVSADGYRTYRQEVRLQSAGQIVLNVQLESTQWGGGVIIDPSRPEAVVYIDSVSSGTGRVERHLPAGEHRIEVVASGFETFRRTVRVGVTGIARVEVNLRRPGEGRTWLLPAAIGAAVVVIGVIVIGAVLANQTAPGYPATWGNVDSIRQR